MSAFHYSAIFLFVILSTSPLAKGDNFQTSLREKCDLEKLCSYYGEEIMIPDPSDCRYYFLCTMKPDGEVGASSASKLCDYGTYFDFDEQTCVKETEDFVCPNSCSSLMEDEFYDSFSYEDMVDLCSPVNSCTDLGAGYKVPDPDDCTQYYVCITNASGHVIPSDNPVSCGIGMYFNVSSLRCVITDPDHPCHEPCLNLNCEYECADEVTVPYLIAVADSCSNYMVCSPGADPLEEYCEEPELYFDGEKCTSNPYACCDGCIPYCNEASIETMDPCNCRKYYLCEEVGVPSEANKYTCPDQQHFNSETKRCEDGILCDSRCSESTPTKRK